MQFLYPAFLWALLALAIPIILHLFHFRRFKKVYFTNVRFLKEIKEETSARSKLRNLLVLLMRLLAIAALVFAFAQPFIPVNDAEVRTGANSVSIYVDNSFSMNALSEDVPLFERARQRAREIVEAYSVEDRFQILTNDFEGRHQRLVSKEDALGLIEELAVSPSVREVETVLLRQQQALADGPNDNQIAFLISDFQENITRFGNFNDTTLSVNLVPLQSVQENNISIDSAWFEAPVQMLNQTNALVIQVKNHGSEDAQNVRLTLRHEGQVKPVGTLAVPAGGVVTDTVNITILRTGWHEAQLQITDFPVQFDDSYFFTFYVSEEINVLVINDGSQNSFLNAAFNGLQYFNADNQSSRNLNFSAFPDYEMIVLNDLRTVSSGLAAELQQYVRNGGNLLAFPAATADRASWNGLLNGFPANSLGTYEPQERTVGTINTEEFVFRDVFENRRANLKLPTTQGNFGTTNFTGRGEERLLVYRDGGSFISKYRVGLGNLYVSAAPLGPTVNDLVRNGEIFIPMLYKMAISSNRNRRIAYTIGDDEVIEADNRISGAGTETVYKLRSTGAGEEFIPEQRTVGAKVFLNVHNQVREAGFYNRFLDEDEVLDKFAFNYSRQESDLATLTAEELQAFERPGVNVFDEADEANLSQIVSERSRGVILWRWFLIAAIVFLILETILLRVWKV